MQAEERPMCKNCFQGPLRIVLPKNLLFFSPPEMGRSCYFLVIILFFSYFRHYCHCLDHSQIYSYYCRNQIPFYYKLRSVDSSINPSFLESCYDYKSVWQCSVHCHSFFQHHLITKNMADLSHQFHLSRWDFFRETK